MWTEIKQFLKKNIFDALSGAASPSSSNVFATMDDITGATTVDLPPVLDILAFGAAVATTGNRYLASATGGGWTIDYIYEYNGASWIETIPVTNNIVDTTTQGWKRYTGSAWANYGSKPALVGGNSVSSPLRVGSRTNQLLYWVVNNVNIARFGNASSTLVHPVRFGGSVTTAPLTNAQAEIASTTKGFLIPRMTKAQRLAISVTAADAGLIVYQTDEFIGDYKYNGSAWLQLVDSAAPYKSCHFTLTQDLTGDPVATILGNDTGATLTFAYSDVGEYSLTLSVGAASATKLVLIPSTFTTSGTFDFITFSGTFGVLRSYNSAGAPANSIFSNQFFELRIYE